jgi:hypothetical protein
MSDETEIAIRAEQPYVAIRAQVTMAGLGAFAARTGEVSGDKIVETASRRLPSRRVGAALNPAQCLGGRRSYVLILQSRRI